MTASCGFGSRTAGTSSTRGDQRDHRRTGGDPRAEQRADPSPAAGATASRRWRRTKRASAAPSSNPSPTAMVPSSSSVGGPAVAGIDWANASADANASPDPPSASSASAVSPIDGRARATSTSRTTMPDDRHGRRELRRPLERGDAHGDREDQLRDRDARERRTTRAAPIGGATAGAGSATSPARSVDQRRVERDAERAPDRPG